MSEITFEIRSQSLEYVDGLVRTSSLASEADVENRLRKSFTYGGFVEVESVSVEWISGNEFRFSVRFSPVSWD